MSANQDKLRWLGRVVRWVALAMTIALLGLFAVFFIGEGGFNPLTLRPEEQAMTAALAVAVVGFIVAWKWELAGGAMILAGMGAFYVVNFLTAGHFPGGPVFPLCFIPGIAFLARGVWKRRHAEEGP